MSLHACVHCHLGGRRSGWRGDLSNQGRLDLFRGCCGLGFRGRSRSKGLRLIADLACWVFRGCRGLEDGLGSSRFELPVALGARALASGNSLTRAYRRSVRNSRRHRWASRGLQRQGLLLCLSARDGSGEVLIFGSHRSPGEFRSLAGGFNRRCSPFGQGSFGAGLSRRGRGGRGRRSLAGGLKGGPHNLGDRPLPPRQRGVQHHDHRRGSQSRCQRTPSESRPGEPTPPGGQVGRLSHVNFCGQR